MTETLRRGIRRSDLESLEHEIESANLDPERRQTMTDELESTRERQQELRKQIDSLRSLLETSQKSIGLDDAHFRSAISSALELIRAEPLKSIPSPDDEPPRMSFPALDQREGSDGRLAFIGSRPETR